MRFVSQIFIILILWTVPIKLLAQTQLSDISITNNCTKKTCKYVKGYKKQGISLFSELEASLCDTASLNSYCVHVGKFYFDSSIDKVWENALISNPIDIWTGKILSLSFIYDKNNDKLYFPSDLQKNSLNTDQIYFINLRLLKGIFNLPTALKVTKIDEEHKIIEFTYLRGGKSEGKQLLQFIAKSDNETEIIHTTYYQSGSRFRDRNLYPFFHQRAIAELHSNVKKGAIDIN
ncbi:MAG TPA: hypothetical protein PLY32_00390 [Salinivirgaceae bacterium]|nr:hypothetical protein [Salinivirgaceae bacterium]HQA75553.1 hypothetical protein [Salinivirgaceae bacterium]